MEKNPRPDIQLPPGFRFHPSDEELIVHYLRKKATKTPLPASIVTEVELYKFNPWDLPKKAVFGDEEWYFFTPRERKYPNGMRPNRTAASGYWKATGIDKPILTWCGSKVIGVKKALVFYTGRPPKGNKTDWIMHEYRLPEPDLPWSAKKQKSMRLDEWVLCRVRQKTAGMPFGNFWEDRNNGVAPSNEPAAQHHPKEMDKQCSTETFEMVRQYIYKEDCPMLPFLFGTSTSQDFPAAMDTVSSISFECKKTPSSVCEDNFSIEYLQNSVPPASDGLSNMRKRKVLEVNNSQENFRQPNKKATARYYQNVEVPPPASASTIDDNVDNGMISQTEKNNVYTVDQLGPTMMYQDLYSLAFA